MSNKCKNCKVKWAQELGLCRSCWNKRIGDKPTPFQKPVKKLAASPPAQAQERPTALELFGELEIALYGKSGNAWESQRAERVIRVLRKALDAAPSAQGWHAEKEKS